MVFDKWLGMILVMELFREFGVEDFCVFIFVAVIFFLFWWGKGCFEYKSLGVAGLKAIALGLKFISWVRCDFSLLVSEINMLSRIM